MSAAQVGHRGHESALFLMRRGRQDKSCSGRRRDRGPAPGPRWREPRPPPSKAARSWARCARRRRPHPAPARRRCCRRPTGLPLRLELVAGRRHELQWLDPECLAHFVEERALGDLSGDAILAPGLNRIGRICSMTGSRGRHVAVAEREDRVEVHRGPLGHTRRSRASPHRPRTGSSPDARRLGATALAEADEEDAVADGHHVAALDRGRTPCRGRRP